MIPSFSRATNVTSTLLLLGVCALNASAGDAEDTEKLFSEIRTVLSQDAVTAFTLPRNWLREDGEMISDCTLETVKSGVVHLKSVAGEISTINLKELSKADQSLILEIAGRKGLMIYAPVGDVGEIRIRYDWFKVYIPKGGSRVSLTFMNVSYREAGETQELTGGYIRVNGKGTKIEVSSSNEAIFTVAQDERPAGTGYSFVFKAPGKTSIRVKVGDLATIAIPLEVAELAVAEGDTIQAVIDAYGLPDEKENVITSWPESRLKDDVAYKPTATESIIEAQHWSYESLMPSLVSIVDDKLHATGLSDAYFRSLFDEGRRWSEGEYDGITRKKPERIQDKEKADGGNAVPSPRLWKDKSGKFSVTATFGGRIASKVILVNEEGKKLYVPFSSLSEADQEWVESRRR